MTLLVKDANTNVQTLSTQLDVAGALVPAHIPSALVGGVAQPASATNPIPVLNTAGAAAVDGSGSIATGGAAQTLFGGTVPVNGFQVGNTSSASLYVSDAGTASATGSSMPIAAGAIYTTPTGYKPIGAVSIYGGTTGQTFAARRW